MEGGLRQPLWKDRLTPKGSLTTHRSRDAVSEVKFPVSKFWGYTHFTFCSLETGSCYVAQPGLEPMGSSDPSASAFPSSSDCRLAATSAVGDYSKPAPCKVSCVPLSPLPLALPSTPFQGAGDLGSVSVTWHQLAYPRVLWNRTVQYSFWCCFLSWLLVLVIILCSSIL